MNKLLILGMATAGLTLAAASAEAGVPYNSPYAIWEPQAIDPEISPDGRAFVSGAPRYARDAYNPGPFGLIGAIGGAAIGVGEAALGVADNIVTGGEYGSGPIQPSPGVTVSNGYDSGYAGGYADAGQGNLDEGRAAYEEGTPVGVLPPSALGPDSIPTPEDRTFFSRGR